MEPEAYGYEAIDLVVLDSEYELYYRGEEIQSWAAEDLLACPNINPIHIYAELKDGKEDIDTEDDETQYAVPLDVFWGKA